jgi:hypothetical protein
MDSRNFDHLARVVGAGTSRRGILKALAGGVFGAAAASLGLAGVSAHQQRSVGNSCLTNSDCASGLCVTESRTRKTCRCVTPSDCPQPTDQCQIATCANGACSNPPKQDGTICDDGDACTQTDTCVNGACIGGNPVVCSPVDQCHDTGVCNPKTGICSNPIKQNGAACDDGDACTQTDECQNGVCVGTNSIVCAALDQCHDPGTCDPKTGDCSNPPKPDGSTCQSGDQTQTCQGGVCCTPATCESLGVECGSVSDGCNATLQCGSCTLGKACQEGQCICPTGSVMCGGFCEPGDCCTAQDCFFRQCSTVQCVNRPVGQSFRNVCDYTPIPECCVTDSDCHLAPCDVSVSCDGFNHQCIHNSACFGCNVCDPNTGGCTATNCNQCQYCGPGGICKADDDKAYQTCGDANGSQQGICSEGECVTCIANDHACQGPGYGDECCSGKCLPNPDPNGFLGDWVCTCRTLIEYCDYDAQCCQGNCAPDPLGSGLKTCQD